MRTILSLFVLAALSAAADKDLAWQSGKVISQDVVREKVGETASALGQDTGSGVHIGGSSSAVFWNQNHVVIDTPEYRYKLIEVTRPTFLSHKQPTLIVVVGSTVRLARDGDVYIILDDGGRQHKFALEGMVSLKDGTTVSTPAPSGPAPEPQTQKRLEDRMMDADLGYRQYRSQLQSWQVVKEIDSTVASLRSAHADYDQMLPFMRTIMEAIRPNWGNGLELGEYLESLYVIAKHSSFAVTAREILTKRAAESR